MTFSQYITYNGLFSSSFFSEIIEGLLKQTKYFYKRRIYLKRISDKKFVPVLYIPLKKRKENWTFLTDFNWITINHFPQIEVPKMCFYITV